MNNMKNKPEDYWKKKLTPEQYRILREKGTEVPFTGELLNTKGKGMYTCAACGQKLFSSDTKFESGSGWPSFWDSVDKDMIELREDNSYGMKRIEVVCSNCGSHLGHVFDVPQSVVNEKKKDQKGYYCINSACLAFKPQK